MSLNSSTFNDSFLNVNLSSSSVDLPFHICYIARPSAFIFATFYISNIIILAPLSGIVLYIGLKRRQRQRSAPTVSRTSHSDSFTYHMVTMELSRILGFILCCWGVFTVHVETYLVGICLWGFTWYGETFFHILTCVERYLAVVHPITYRGLRGERGIRIRNICILCVWLLCAGAVSLMTSENASAQFDLVMLSLSLTIIPLCSVTVLWVLVHPGPGENPRERSRVDQSKLWAFYTIVTILGVVLLRFVWNMIWNALVLGSSDECVFLAAGVWLNLPCSLVLPLLFLHRAGKTMCSTGPR